MLAYTLKMFSIKQRNSNIEALRIVAMFLILMIHVNVFSIGEPTTEEAINNPLPTFTRCFFESISLISVNLFVLITGWFSILFSIRRLLSFVFQSVFIITLIFALGLYLGYATIDEHQVLECLFMGKYGWFIKAYLGLMILAPALNSFIENASKRNIEVILVTFFSFQALYGCFTTNTDFISCGYSTFSFAGLYLLARYVRLYGKSWIENAGRITIISAIIYVLWGYLPVRLGVMRLYYMSLIYTNPANIAVALGVLLFAVGRKPKYNKIVNWIAASTFAVYLCHMCNTWTADMYKHISRVIYNNFSGVSYLGTITLFMVLVFAISIFIDKPRKWLWSRVVQLPPPSTPGRVNKY